MPTKPAAIAAKSGDLTLLTPAEAGTAASCSEAHIYRLIWAGELRAVDISQPGSKRSKTRVRSDDLAAYIESRTRVATGHPGAAVTASQAEHAA